MKKVALTAKGGFFRGITSTLNSDTVCRIEKMLLGLENTTVIHVAHKPSEKLTKLYDAVLTMEEGRISGVLYQSREAA